MEENKSDPLVNRSPLILALRRGEAVHTEGLGAILVRTLSMGAAMRIVEAYPDISKAEDRDLLLLSLEKDAVLKQEDEGEAPKLSKEQISQLTDADMARIASVLYQQKRVASKDEELPEIVDDSIRAYAEVVRKELAAIKKSMADMSKSLQHSFLSLRSQSLIKESMRSSEQIRKMLEPSGLQAALAFSRDREQVAAQIQKGEVRVESIKPLKVPRISFPQQPLPAVQRHMARLEETGGQLLELTTAGLERINLIGDVANSFLADLARKGKKEKLGLGIALASLVLSFIMSVASYVQGYQQNKRAEMNGERSGARTMEQLELTRQQLNEQRAQTTALAAQVTLLRQEISVSKSTVSSNSIQTKVDHKP